MTTAETPILTRAEPEIASRIAFPSPRPTCRVGAAGEDGTCHAETPNGNGSSIQHQQSAFISENSEFRAPHSALDSSSIAASNSQPSTLNSQPARKLSRNGKVARLPYLQRDMVNRMLRNNVPHERIVDALGEVGVVVTRRNISNWKTRGGYKEWCIEQDRAVQTRLFQENLLEYLRKNDASQLPEIGLQLAATHLSEFFAKPETRQQLASCPEKYTKTLGILCRLAGQIQSLQKYRDDSAKALGYKHNPERIKRETEANIESVRDTFCSYIPPNAPIDPEVPHRNFIPRS